MRSNGILRRTNSKFMYYWVTHMLCFVQSIQIFKVVITFEALFHQCIRQWIIICLLSLYFQNLLSRLQDRDNIICATETDQDTFAGQKVEWPCISQLITLHHCMFQISELDPSLLCPPSAGERNKEVILQLLCVVLAILNIFVFSKLLYDYWQYKRRGKLPRIVYWLP